MVPAAAQEGRAEPRLGRTASHCTWPHAMRRSVARGKANVCVWRGFSCWDQEPLGPSWRRPGIASTLIGVARPLYASPSSITPSAPACPGERSTSSCLTGVTGNSTLFSSGRRRRRRDLGSHRSFSVTRVRSPPGFRIGIEVAEQGNEFSEHYRVRLGAGPCATHWRRWPGLERVRRLNEKAEFAAIPGRPTRSGHRETPESFSTDSE